MLATTLRRSAAPKRLLSQLQNQRRNGGSLSKNKHIENWNNWRGDSEKRFKFDSKFFTSIVAWGLIPYSLYYVLSVGERRKRDARNGLPENFRK